MKIISFSQVWLLVFTLILLTACSGQDNAREKLIRTHEPLPHPKTPSGPQIAQYIRHIYQDKNGDLWFGTNGYGVAQYDGDSISYYSNAQGFGGQQITGIVEDKEKSLWFATDQGIVKYEFSMSDEGAKHFVNYTDQQYFGGQRLWSIFADSKGIIWAGSVSDIFQFDTSLNDKDGQSPKWSRFELPYPDDVTGDFITTQTTWSITEDRKGNIWFSTNGYGAYKYDGSNFTRYTEKDGLTDNSVDQILEDRNGDIWFGTRHGGISRFDGEYFVNYTQRNGSIGNDEVCVIYEDRVGNVWFSSEGFGVYRYNTHQPEGHLTNFSEKQGLGVRAVQTIFEDKDGHIWVGGGGGLYKYDTSPNDSVEQTKSFVNVTKNGPWK